MQRFTHIGSKFLKPKSLNFFSAFFSGFDSRRMPPRQKRYTPEQMEEAVEKIKSGELSQRKASKLYGVPVMTLSNRISGKSQKSTPGPRPVFSENMKQAFAKKLKELSDTGCGLTKRSILAMAADFCREAKVSHPFKDGPAGETWYRKFMRQNPDLSVRAFPRLSVRFSQGHANSYTEKEHQQIGDVPSLEPQQIRDVLSMETQAVGDASSMELRKVVEVLKGLAAPSLAGSWDNVGLLLEPSPPHMVNSLLLTNDLTPSVMQEAVDKDVDMIVSYHPPIFSPLKRVTQASWKERIAGRCMEQRIALYSPHTSWDAAVGGVNDWLIGAFDVSESKPIEQTEQTDQGRSKKLSFFTSPESAKVAMKLPLLQQHPSIKVYTEQSGAGDDNVKTKVCFQCWPAVIPDLLATLDENHIITENMEFCDLAKKPSIGHGMGRVGRLRTPITLETAVATIKAYLKLPHVRLAQTAEQSEIKTVAVCAGSGASVLRGVKADLYLTGEMSHHEVLDAVCKGTSVVLCDHSNTERGFLSVIQGNLEKMLTKGVQVIVSEKDCDPLVIV